MSFDNAFSGDTYSTSVVSGRPNDKPSRTSASIAVRNAVRVLPEPVGAEIQPNLSTSLLHRRILAGVHRSSCDAGSQPLRNRERNSGAITGNKVAAGMSTVRVPSA